jgi:hypothetical protein
MLRPAVPLAPLARAGPLCTGRALRAADGAAGAAEALLCGRTIARVQPVDGAAVAVAVRAGPFGPRERAVCIDAWTSARPAGATVVRAPLVGGGAELAVPVRAGALPADAMLYLRAMVELDTGDDVVVIALGTAAVPLAALAAGAARAAFEAPTQRGAARCFADVVARGVPRLAAPPAAPDAAAAQRMLDAAIAAPRAAMLRATARRQLEPNLHRVTIDRWRAARFDMPGEAFFWCMAPSLLSDAALAALFAEALARHGVAAAAFAAGAPADAAVAAVLGTALTLLSTSVRYAYDYEYDGAEVRTTDIFGDALAGLSGDCEDFAWWIVAVARAARRYAGADPVLRAAARMLRSYVPCAALMLVSGAKLADGHGARRMRYDDAAFVPGAHLCAALVPVRYFRACLARGGGGAAPDVALPRGAVDDAAPLLLLEGTGWLRPVVSPPAAAAAHAAAHAGLGAGMVERLMQTVAPTESPNSFYYIVTALFPATRGWPVVGARSYGTLFTATATAAGLVHGASAADMLALAPRVALLPAPAPPREYAAFAAWWAQHVAPAMPLGVASHEFRAQVRAAVAPTVARLRALPSWADAPPPAGARRAVYVFQPAEFAAAADALVAHAQHAAAVHARACMLADGVATVALIVVNRA